MTVFAATLQLYRSAAVETGAAVARSIWALPLLLGGFAVLAVIDAFMLAPLAGTGFFAGILRAFVGAAVVGTYLSILEVTVNGANQGLRAIPRHFGRYALDLLTIVFVLWLIDAVTLTMAPTLRTFVLPLVALAFNPVPEVVYQSRSTGLDALGDALVFMQESWPEWLGAQIPGVAVLVLLDLVLYRGFGGAQLVDHLSAFGPFFGFLWIGARSVQDAIGPAPIPGVINTLAVLAVTHFVMLFRGFVFRRLSGTNRRARAWRARM
jgi:hypothetical protein